MGLRVIKVSRAKIPLLELTLPADESCLHSLALGPGSIVKANSITSSNLFGSDPVASLWSTLAHIDHSGKSPHLKILNAAARPLLTGEVIHPTGSRARTWTFLEVIMLPQNLYLLSTLSQEVREDVLHHNMGINETGEDMWSKRRGARKFLGRGGPGGLWPSSTKHSRASGVNRPVSKNRMKPKEHVHVGGWMFPGVFMRALR